MNDRAKRPVPARTLLTVIDVQQRLAPAMDADLGARLLENLARLGAASRTLGLQTLITEQYPKGLGPTVDPVKDAFADTQALPKVTFDALEDPAIAARLAEIAPDTVVVAGMEAHICVFQTVRSLVASGRQVLVLQDAVASRTADNHQVGLGLCREAGAIVTSTEAVLFDLLGRAGTDGFRAISKLVR